LKALSQLAIEVMSMNKKRSLALKLAILLVAITPFVAERGKLFAGEPKLPAKIHHKA